MKFWLYNILDWLCILAAIALLLLAAGLLTGCLHTRVESPDGWKFDRTSFLQKTTAGVIIVPIGTNQVEIRSYANDGVAAAAQITEAATRGFAQGLK